MKIWGKRPAGVSGNIEIWRRKPTGSWRKVTTFVPGANFGKTYKSSWSRGFYKAVIQQPGQDIVSVPFSLKKVRDRSVLPFGCLSTPTCKANGKPLALSAPHREEARAEARVVERTLRVAKRRRERLRSQPGAA